MLACHGSYLKLVIWQKGLCDKKEVANGRVDPDV